MKKQTEIQKAQNLIAQEFGKIAHQKGMKAIPCQDKNLMDMIKDSKVIGASIPLLKAWQAGWTKSNLKAAV